MPREFSSAQPNVFGAPLTNPDMVVGCQAEMKAPAGSWKTAMRPWSPTSNGGATTVPPAARTSVARLSASGVPM